MQIVTIKIHKVRSLPSNSLENQDIKNEMSNSGKI